MHHLSTTREGHQTYVSLINHQRRAPDHKSNETLRVRDVTFVVYLITRVQYNKIIHQQTTKQTGSIIVL